MAGYEVEPASQLCVRSLYQGACLRPLTPSSEQLNTCWKRIVQTNWTWKGTNSPLQAFLEWTNNLLKEAANRPHFSAFGMESWCFNCVTLNDSWLIKVMLRLVFEMETQELFSVRWDDTKPLLLQSTTANRDNWLRKIRLGKLSKFEKISFAAERRPKKGLFSANLGQKKGFGFFLLQELFHDNPQKLCCCEFRGDSIFHSTLVEVKTNKSLEDLELGWEGWYGKEAMCWRLGSSNECPTVDHVFCLVARIPSGGRGSRRARRKRQTQR